MDNDGQVGLARKSECTAAACGWPQEAGDASHVALTYVAAPIGGRGACVARKGDGAAVAGGRARNGGHASFVDPTAEQQREKLASHREAEQNAASVTVQAEDISLGSGLTYVSGPEAFEMFTKRKKFVTTIRHWRWLVIGAVAGAGIALWDFVYKVGVGGGWDAPNLSTTVACKCDGTAGSWGHARNGGYAANADLTNATHAMYVGRARKMFLCVKRKSRLKRQS